MMERIILDKPKIYFIKNKHLRGRKTLVFIHGLSGSSSAWNPYLDSFGKDFNVLAIDIRGHGRSGKLPSFEDYSMKGCADDLLQILKHAGVKRCIIICHSFGTLITQEFLKSHQEMAEKIIFLSPSYKPSARMITKAISWPLQAAKLLSHLPVKGKGRHVDYSKHIMTGDWNLPRMFEDIKSTSLRVYLFGTLHSCHCDYTELLRGLKVPTLIIHGDKDSIFPLSQAKAMETLIPGCRLVILKGANHILVLNYVDELKALIRGFIKER